MLTLGRHESKKLHGCSSVTAVLLAFVPPVAHAAAAAPAALAADS
jgi:hypothetical protein